MSINNIYKTYNEIVFDGFSHAVVDGIEYEIFGGDGDEVILRNIPDHTPGFFRKKVWQVNNFLRKGWAEEISNLDEYLADKCVKLNNLLSAIQSLYTDSYSSKLSQDFAISEALKTITEKPFTNLPRKVYVRFSRIKDKPLSVDFITSQEDKAYYIEKPADFQNPPVHNLVTWMNVNRVDIQRFSFDKKVWISLSGTSLPRPIISDNIWE